ncbi:TMEM175 family protein [Streptomyces sp. NPDC088354]|uniref:TMEM175 family protein n=1 Tax=unclassified Streptomyces TaxID=2593676 RepID=UPI0029A30BD5|nr:TMEM175 family protein [Streptomyces sp. MI02-7b]MDX3076910.1 TMEM175 family protein [Streptomyces sp. MI02-7b]
MASAADREQPSGASDDDGTRLTDTGRVEAFSDGVFAIVITLLVLDLYDHDFRSGDLASALVAQWPAYVAFVVSFVYVGVIWLNHHALFRRIRRMDCGLLWINLAILFSTVIVPFPTAVLGDALAKGGGADDQRVAVVLYALVAAVMSAPWWGVFTYLCHRPALVEPGVPPRYLRAQRIRPLTGLVLYVVCGVGGWFVGPVVGMVCIGVVILYHALTSEGLHQGPAGRLFGVFKR